MDKINTLAKLFGINIIDENRNYWLVRTKGGQYFDDFYFDEYIAINWNKINDLGLINGDFEILRDKITKEYPDENRPGLVAGQIVRFVKEMKKGDIVLVPNKDSKFIAFGEILEDNIYFENIKNADLIEDMQENDGVVLNEENTDDTCPFVKRRRVKWLDTIKRDSLDPYLERVLRSHNTISDANKYAQYIDRSLNNLFIKGGQAHVIFEVTQTDKIPAVELIEFINSNLSIIDEFNSITESDLRKEDVDIRINVQSPGPIEFFGDPTTIIGIAVTGIVIAGGGVKFKQTFDSFEGDVNTDGIIEKVIKFVDIIQKNGLENKKLNEQYKKSVEYLEIETPKTKD